MTGYSSKQLQYKTDLATVRGDNVFKWTIDLPPTSDDIHIASTAAITTTSAAATPATMLLNHSPSTSARSRSTLSHSKAVGKPAWGAAQEVYPGVYIGSFASAMTFAPLERNGITHIVNCAHEFQCKFPSHIKYLHLLLRDQTHQALLPVLKPALEFITSALQEGGRVLLHCANGSSRSGSLAVAFLMHNQNQAQKSAKLDGAASGVTQQRTVATHEEIKGIARESKGLKRASKASKEANNSQMYESGLVSPLQHALVVAQTARKKIKPNPGFLEQLELWVALGFRFPDDLRAHVKSSSTGTFWSSLSCSEANKVALRTFYQDYRLPADFRFVPEVNKTSPK